MNFKKNKSKTNCYDEKENMKIYITFVIILLKDKEIQPRLFCLQKLKEIINSIVHRWQSKIDSKFNLVVRACQLAEHNCRLETKFMNNILF